MTSNLEQTPEQQAEIQASRLKALQLIRDSNMLNPHMKLEEVLTLSEQLFESNTTVNTGGCLIYSGCMMTW